MKENFIQFEDGNLYYKIVGTGDAIMLVHGFAEDGTIWENIIENLAKYYTLIIPDLPGVGGSINWTNVPTTLIEYPHLLKQILDKEGFSTCIMIGHSMGGYITLEFAAQYPNLLHSIVLFHSSAYADSEEKIQARKKSIEFIKQYGSAEFLKTSIPGLFYDEIKNNSDIKRLVEKGQNISPTTLINNYIAMMARKDHRQLLQTLCKPIAFIIGKHDKAVPYTQGLQQVSIPIQSQVYILRESSHMGMFEDKEKSNQLLGIIFNLQHDLK